MLADVLTSAASWHSEQPLLTYLVPPELDGTIQPGHLVAVPYGERLVEGLIWRLHATGDEILLENGVQADTGENFAVRPIRELLDEQPALLPHQIALAEWMAAYYATPLAQVAQMMLPPGLMQRSRYVLRLAEDHQEHDGSMEAAPFSIRALVGLLLEDGEIDVERLKKMLGPTRAKQILREVRTQSLVEYGSQLRPPRAKPLVKQLVRLSAQGPALQEWYERTQERVQQGLQHAQQVSIEHEPMPVSGRGRQKKHVALNPWSTIGVATMPPIEPDQATVAAQRQLAAVELLQQNGDTDWTCNRLRKASSLTNKQLHQLVQDGIITIERAEVRRDPLKGYTLAASTPLALTEDQQKALSQIVGAQASSERPIVLHGVTGSGKTEVYLQALAAVISQGKRGVLLVPEIALTTQAVQRVAGRFPNRVAIIHSDLSIGERYDEWRRIRSGQIDIVIGSRSALFAPVPELGLIILDEEHEPSYKQSDLKPTYHARQVAVQLGQLLHIPVVLGSATPAVETYYRAQQGIYHLVAMPGRIGAALPPVEIVDLRNELHAGNTSIISRRLHEELENVLERGQQAILFLNRRGAASCVLCRDCGFVAFCNNCDIPLTYHATERILLCHYCGRRDKMLHFCPHCKSSSIRYFGLGTEKVQATIQQNFPAARLLRWDRDTARTRGAHAMLLERFARREADILIGTQMIAKGLDLPGVTLVGVVSADIALGLPDYATPERTFNLLTQVAGRAGRGSEAGRVVVQTFNPQHFCIDTASRHDYHEFYAAEIEARRSFGYPPFRQFVKFRFSHKQRHRCQNEALLLYERLTEWIDRLALENTDVVGPAPAAMERVRGQYHWQIIVRGPELHRLLRVIDAPGWSIDIDPVSTL